MFRLYTVLTGYDDWFNAEFDEPMERIQKNIGAKQALCEYRQQLLKVGPNKNLEERNVSESYPKRLSKIEDAFSEEKYMRVCYELISLMYYEPFLKEGVHQDIVELLERNLNES
ncbi:hypothetical protein ACA30_13225 [Virgibacillus soli]|nr:hypothetical protein ACA30_13225 [Virgibacillus soli]